MRIIAILNVQLSQTYTLPSLTPPDVLTFHCPYEAILGELFSKFPSLMVI